MACKECVLVCFLVKAVIKFLNQVSLLLIGATPGSAWGHEVLGIEFGASFL